MQKKKIVNSLKTIKIKIRPKIADLFMPTNKDLSRKSLIKILYI